jgi:Eco57I restriction-modification methylase
MILAALFESAFQKYDIYALFVENGINLLVQRGNLGFIIPNKIMATSVA